jgi:perosamine synthetase
MNPLSKKSKVRHGPLNNNILKKHIPVAEPVLNGNEKAYVVDCLDTTWISSNGSYIERFEQAFAGFIGVKYALSVSNGTMALHAALLGLGVGPGDEVIVPTLTYIATGNAVRYCGAEPIFVDSEPVTWNIDPDQIEEKITSLTKGIIPVHLYGHPADMDPICNLAEKYGLFVLEDAAEAHGAEYEGQKVGSIGDAAIFSFYGNKIITTGEGGMVVTDDEALACRIRQIKGQGQDFEKRYWFPIIGYNYRMTNVQAAIGLAQLENVDWHINRRREVAGWYHKFLDGISAIKLQPELPNMKNVYWMNSIVLQPAAKDNRDNLMKSLATYGIETRPFFYPIHTMPPYYSNENESRYPVAERVAASGINLPTSSRLTKNEIEYICMNIIELI